MPTRPTKEEVENHNLTDVFFRKWRRCCVVMRAREQPHHLVRSEDGTPKVIIDWMLFTSDNNIGFQMPVLIVHDLVSEPSHARSTTIHEPYKLWWRLWRLGDTGTILHADGEPSTRGSVAAAQEHRTLPRHGPPHSRKSQGSVESCIGVYQGSLGANKLHLEANVGMKTSLRDGWVDMLPWLMRYNTGTDGMSLCRRLYGKQDRTSLGARSVDWEAGVNR